MKQVFNPRTLPIAVAVFAATALGAFASGWNFEDGPAAGVLNAIQEMLPVYVNDDKTCKDAVLSGVLKKLLNALVAKEDLDDDSADEDSDTNDPKDKDAKDAKIVVRALQDSEKSCLAKAVKTLLDDRTSKDAVSIGALKAVDESFGLGLKIKVEKEKK